MKEQEDYSYRQSCLTCRVIGTTVCLGLSAHLVHTASQQTSGHHAMGSPMSRAFILAFAGGFAALGVARALIE